MTETKDKTGKRRSGVRWVVLIAAVVLVLGAASAYAVRWHYRFYHHITPQELSHEVRRSVFQATIRGGPALQLQVYQQENAAHQPLVLFTTAHRAWSPFSPAMPPPT